MYNAGNGRSCAIRREFMPRVSKAKAEQNREAIEKAASQLFKARGIHNVSVNEVMSAAGLTHGGFYGHFDSKEALAAVACAHAFADSAKRWKARVEAESSPAAARRRIVNGYLSGQSKTDDPSSICPMLGLVSDITREPDDSSIRQRYAEGVKALADILCSTQDTPSRAERRRRGLADLASMVGAAVLARALEGDPLGDEIVKSTRRALGLT